MVPVAITPIRGGGSFGVHDRSTGGLKMHVIRLRRPWQKSVFGVAQPGVADVPDSDGSDSGEVEYRRRFNLPSGLDGNARVHLRVESWVGQLLQISLNGTSLQAGNSSADVDVTDLLQRQNELFIRLSGRPGHPTRLSGPVTLAIEE
jgi:hypothetical protein